MKTFLERAPVWIFGMIVGFYTTFVLQNLWNWFVVPTLHATEISYWQMFGLNLLLIVALEHDTSLEEYHWKRALTMLYISVPSDKKDGVDETLKEEDENIWFNIGTKIFEKLGRNTFTLVLGWSIHSFLA
jgi:hypothetical protein